MSKLNNVWVMTSNIQALPELCAGAKLLGEKTAVLYVGDKASAAGCDTVYYLGEGPWLGCIDTMIELVKKEKPALVLTSTNKNDRLAAGRVAAAVGAGLVADAAAVSVNEEGQAVVERMVYGGAAVLTAKGVSETLIVTASAGMFEATELNAAAEVIDVEVGAAAGIRCLNVKPKAAVKVNLKTAKKVVGVGRGVSSEEDLATVQQLCEVIGADIGCTRPIAEESQWLPRERYIGVSGVMLKPELYVSLGISGQVQHTVGISGAGTIVVVNKDKNAPMFQYADYGIVGDLKKIVPMLIDKLK